MAPNNRLDTAGCGPVRHISRASLRADHSSGPWTEPDGPRDDARQKQMTRWI